MANVANGVVGFAIFLFIIFYSMKVFSVLNEHYREGFRNYMEEGSKERTVMKGIMESTAKAARAALSHNAPAEIDDDVCPIPDIGGSTPDKCG